jgi:threonine dehydrogenase-like Zn-dependent dehydrogenase
VTAPGRVDIVRGQVPEPGEGQVRIAVEGCGVCGSNLPVWQGRPWFEYPLPPGAPGHEAWGRVEAAGGGVDGLRPGDRVAFLDERSFAESVLVDAAKAVVLPPALDDRPFPGEALACGFNAARRADLRPGQTVAVVGIGFLGAVIAARAVAAGARVVAVSRRDFALDLARAMGAHEVIRMGERWEVVDAVKALTDGALCDRVVEAVGLQEPLDVATELTGDGGRLVVAGFHQDGRRSIDMQLWNWRGIEVVNAHERDERVVLDGIREAAAAVADGSFDPSPLYTDEVPLERLDEALDAVAERPEGFLKALVRT